MKIVHTSGRFKKEYKHALKRGKDGRKLQLVIDMLAAGQPLPERFKPHRLGGEYAGKWECHIEPDWLLIYEITDEEIQLFRLGTHSDLC